MIILTTTSKSGRRQTTWVSWGWRAIALDCSTEVKFPEWQEDMNTNVPPQVQNKVPGSPKKCRERHLKHDHRSGHYNAAQLHSIPQGPTPVIMPVGTDRIHNTQHSKTVAFWVGGDGHIFYT